MKKEFGFWFWMHALLLVLAYLSPLYISWKLIIIGAIILQIQYWIIDGCILTHLEMGKDKNETFIWYYLRKIYLDLNPKTTKIFIRVIVPVLLIVISIILQIKLGFKPLIHFWKF